MQETMTPLMRQYNEIKNSFLNNILFFQLGDFYELFNDDAILVSSLLGLTLTKRGETPMCGIPVGNLNFYIKKLVNETPKPIAIASQTTEPTDGKGLVKREVTKIITKGNYVDMLSFDNNFILSIIPDKKENICYICYADLSTGETFTEEISRTNLLSEIYRINPSEILIEASKENMLELGMFEEIITEYALNSSEKQNHRSLALIVAYKNYLKNTIELKVKHRNNQTYMKFGDNTLKNLDIFENYDSKYTLFSILNKTQTPEGKRYLKSVLCRPIIDKKKIEIRLDAIEETIKYLYNIEKISIPSGDLSKMINNIADIKILKKTSELILNYQQIIQNTPFNFLKTYKNSAHSSLKNHLYILENILEDTNNITFIHEEIRNLQQERNSILENIYALPEKYKINCKVKNNNLIGFFFEFTKNTDLIPKNWILKQGLSTSSRYTNEDLILLENQFKTLENQLVTIEKELFHKMKDLLLEEIEEIKKLTEIIGKLDFILSCAQNAIELSMIRPKFSEDNKINIHGGYHPVLFSKDRNFIDNDLFLDHSVSQIIITGPNMGGKSTFLRQNALCILMAQCGMFVPAKLYESKIFSSLFVRMGASDNIAEKESTFMVEMKECSNIINSIDENSFVVLDEIGRGTSTRDGISISMAIIEYISQEINCFALISTHYKELCSSTLQKLQFFKADVKISNNNNESKIVNKIIFLYKIVPGIAEDSFGIHVAEMSNLPQSILTRARSILNSF